LKNRTVSQVRSEQKKRSRFLFALFLAGIVYLAVHFLLGDMGYLSYRQLVDAREDIQQEIVAIERRNDTLQGEADALQKDPEYIEKMARENLGLGREGEMIFHFDE